MIEIINVNIGQSNTVHLTVWWDDTKTIAGSTNPDPLYVSNVTYNQNQPIQQVLAHLTKHASEVLKGIELNVPVNPWLTLKGKKL